MRLRVRVSRALVKGEMVQRGTPKTGRATKHGASNKLIGGTRVSVVHRGGLKDCEPCLDLVGHQHAAKFEEVLERRHLSFEHARR